MVYGKYILHGDYNYIGKLRCCWRKLPFLAVLQLTGWKSGSLKRCPQLRNNLLLAALDMLSHSITPLSCLIIMLKQDALFTRRFFLLLTLFLPIKKMDCCTLG